MNGEGQAGKRKSPSEKVQLAGKIAPVIGASRGIGRAIALGVAEAGCDVVLVSRKLADSEDNRCQTLAGQS